MCGRFTLTDSIESIIFSFKLQNSINFINPRYNIFPSEKIPVILKKGQAALHHCLLAHGSGPNKTNFPRIGIAVRYLPTHVKQTKGPPISMILVRGEDQYNNFKMDEIPTGDFDSKSIAEHNKASSPHAASNYATS